MRDGIFSFYVRSGETPIRAIALVEKDSIKGFNRSHIYYLERLKHSLNRLRKDLDLRLTKPFGKPVITMTFRPGFGDEIYDTFSGCIKDNSISLGFLTCGDDADPLGKRDKSPVSMNRFKAAMDNAYSKPLILSRMIPMARVEFPDAVLTDTSALVIQYVLPLINLGVNG